MTAQSHDELADAFVRVRVIIEVLAGLLPETPEVEFTRRIVITSEEWEEAKEGQVELLARKTGEAEGYAHMLMLQPDRLNWVRVDWLWL